MPTRRFIPIVLAVFAVGLVALPSHAIDRRFRSSTWLSFQTQNESWVDRYGRNLDGLYIFAYDFNADSDVVSAAAINDPGYVDREMAYFKTDNVGGRRPVYLNIVNHLEGDPQNHNGNLVYDLLSDPARRAKLVSEIVALSPKADGVEIDFESVQGRTRDFYSQFIKELRTALPADKKITVDLQPKWQNHVGDLGFAFDYKAIEPYVDDMRILYYYFSYSSSPPGPVISYDWINQMVDYDLHGPEAIPLKKLHVVLSLFGWDWKINPKPLPPERPGKIIYYERFVRLASDHSLTPQRDPVNGDLHFQYTDSSGTLHETWMDDVESLKGKIHHIQDLGVKHIDFWHIGTNEPFWRWLADQIRNDPEVIPQISQLVPDVVAVGSPAFTLNLTGTDFTDDTIVLWNGKKRRTTFVSETQLTAAIPASDLKTVGIATVTVQNYLGTSQPKPFYIDNPPVLLSINPTFAIAGSPAFTLQVTGAWFTSDAKVLWNNTPRPTTFVSSTTLVAGISASDIVAPGTASVQVANFVSTSTALSFEIRGPAGILRLDPDSAEAGGPAFLLKVVGWGFTNATTVLWHGQERTTVFVSSGQLNASILATDIAKPGEVPVTVRRPDFTSPPRNFSVLAPPPKPAITTFTEMRVFPNPWVASKNAGRSVRFDNLPDNTVIKLYTVSARWVKTLSAPGGFVDWDLTNDSGENVASGYYIYVLEDPAGNQTRGKLAVVR